MKTIHPNLDSAAATVLTIALTVFGGCSSQQTPFKNPFSAADRVPPPSTRVLPPGAAQPYYPGDPLPVMQSATAAPGAAIVSSSAPPTVVPAGAIPAPSPPSVDDSAKLAFSNERAVAIPGDDDSLRFDLPPPQPPEPAAPIAATTTAPAQPTATAPTPPPANQPTAGGVVPATYLAAPADTQGATNAAFADTTNAPASTTPWRSPQAAPTTATIPGASSVGPPLAASPPIAYPPIHVPPVAAPYYSPAPMPPGFAPQPAMDVQLRAVPSPPPQPVDPSTPRIRLPGYPTPQPVTTTATGVQQAAYTQPMLTYDPALGTLVVVGGSNAAAGAPALASPSSDGFRPRSSSR